ncbi:ChaB family protein [Leptolyngbya sp. NIES-3755]|nr:ChaB family protein [Leptolyngbya sp. NIES-3755]
MPTGSERTQANPQISAEDKQFEAVNSVETPEDQANLATSKSTPDKIAEQRDDVDEQNEKLPAEVTDQLLDGSDQVFLTAFKNSQKDGLSREAAIKVAWNSVKQGFQQSQDGSWHRKGQPDDRTIGSGVGGSAS